MMCVEKKTYDVTDSIYKCIFILSKYGIVKCIVDTNQLLNCRHNKVHTISQ